MGKWVKCLAALIIPIVWFVICMRSGFDNPAEVIVSDFFLGLEIPMMVFMIAGTVLFCVNIGLIASGVKALESERATVKFDSSEHQRLGKRNALVGLVLILALLSMPVGAFMVAGTVA